MLLRSAMEMEMERWNDGGSQQEFGSSRGIKRAMIKNRGKRDHKPISSHAVTLTFFPPFLFHFWCFKRIKILSQFRTTINQHFHASSSSNWYFLLISPQSQIDTIKPQLTSKGVGTSASGPFSSSAMFRSVLATVVVAVPVLLGGVV